MAIKKILLVFCLVLLFGKALAFPVELEHKYNKTTFFSLTKEEDGKTGVYFITKDTVEVYVFNNEDTARQYYIYCLRPSSKKVRKVKGGIGYGVWKGKNVSMYEER